MNFLRAETNEDLYKKVFGHQTEVREILTSAVLEERIIGDVRVKAQGKKLISVNRDDLIAALKNMIFENQLQSILSKNLEIQLQDLPFAMTYLENELILEMDVPEFWLRPNEKSFLDDFIPYYSKKAVNPAPFSFQLNYKAEYLYQSNKTDRDNILGVVDNAMFLNGFVLDNDLTYNQLKKERWFRESTVLTYDFQDRLTRFQGGDVANSSIGFLQSKNLGGISLFRDFSLNPYRVSYPTSRFDFTLTKRSLVRTYVNNLLIKSEYLNPGKHTLKDIPLNNGVNKILVEIEDEFGERRVLTFNEASSQDLLARGQNRFDLTFGKISRDLDDRKDYNVYSDLFYSGFYQFGHRKNLTLGGYVQGLGSFTLLGSQAILASRRGNIILDAAKSFNEDFNGFAARATYQLSLFGPYWYDSHTLTARIENRSERFNETETKSTNFFDLLSTVNYSVPILDALNVSLGVNHAKSRDSLLSDKWGGDFSLGAKINNDAILTFSYARSRDENEKWQTLAYAFLNINLPERSTYVSAFYDRQSNLQRLTAIHDSGKRLNDLKLSAVAEQDKEGQQASIDTTYNTQLIDLGLRLEHTNPKNSENYYRAIPRLLGGVTIVHQDGQWGGSISRPINGSFAIFKPHNEFKDQSFGIRSYGNETESKTGVFGEALLTGLTPYQYRQVQLDPTYLDPGYSLGQESFVLLPYYKSGHLFIVGEAGRVALRGKIVDSKENVLAYKVGYLIEVGVSEKIIPFFTNKSGNILIEGVAPKKYILKIEEFSEQEIDLTDKKGFIEFGSIKMMSQKEVL